MPLQYVFALVSDSFYRKSLSFQWRKLALAEEFGHGGDQANGRNHSTVYKNRFAVATSGQFWALFRHELFQPSLSGSLTLAALLACCCVTEAFCQYSQRESQNVCASILIYIKEIIIRLIYLPDNVTWFLDYVSRARDGWQME